MRIARKILKISGIVLGAVLTLAVAYVIYVFASYHRLDDRLPLAAENNPSGAVPVGTPLSAVTFNLGFGAYSEDYSFFMDGGKYSRAYSEAAVCENIDGMAETLRRLAPDFLLLQEVDVRANRSHHVDERARLYGALPGYGFVFAENYDSPYLFYPFTSPHGKSYAGTVTGTKYAVSSALRRSLPVETGFSKLLDLDRCYSVTRIPTENGKALCLYNLHLSAYTTDGTIADEQLEMLTADMAAEYAAGNYCVAGGDFNKDLLGNSAEIFGVSGDDYTWAKPIREGSIPAGLRLVAPSGAPSCRNADKPYVKGESFVLTVDGFLVSDNVGVTLCETQDEGFAHSDHNPVRLCFSLLP